MKLLIITAILPVSIASAATGNPNEKSCELPCQNNGYCIHLSKTEMLSDENNLKPPIQCICPDGNNGILCDMHKHCFNFKESNTSHFAKEMCNKPKTVYCDNGVDDAINRNCFCTNGGTCRDYKSPDDECTKCDCPDEFGGPHCAFFLPALDFDETWESKLQDEDSKSYALATSSQSNSENDVETISEDEQQQMHPIVRLSLIICIISAFVFLCALFIDYRNRIYQDSIMRAVEDLDIDSDDVTCYEGSITAERTGKKSKPPPTDVIVELSGKSQRHLSVSFKNDDDYDYYDDEFDNNSKSEETISKLVKDEISKIEHKKKKNMRIPGMPSRSRQRMRGNEDDRCEKASLFNVEFA